jgi:hypothetical protein
MATYDLTTKTEKYIELTHDTSRYHNKSDAIASKLSTIKAQIQARYKHSSVIILECPPDTVMNIIRVESLEAIASILL